MEVPVSLVPLSLNFTFNKGRKFVTSNNNRDWRLLTYRTFKEDLRNVRLEVFTPEIYRRIVIQF